MDLSAIQKPKGKKQLSLQTFNSASHIRIQRYTPTSYLQTSRNVISTIIMNKLLTAHFQPIIELKTNSVYAHEALCRTLAPNPFTDIEELFDFAHRCDLTLALDMYCRENSIALAARQDISSEQSLLFINICPSSLTHPHHSAGNTEFLCKQYGIDKSRVVLEITEQEAIHNYTLFANVVAHYREAGFKIAIDDFGAGYGGLKMLSVIEPDYIKIDRHFFNEITKESINFTLITAIVTACNCLDIQVVAEGIETAHELKIAQEIGINLVQGYHLGKPQQDLTKKTH